MRRRTNNKKDDKPLILGVNPSHPRDRLRRRTNNKKDDKPLILGVNHFHPRGRLRRETKGINQKPKIEFDISSLTELQHGNNFITSIKLHNFIKKSKSLAERKQLCRFKKKFMIQQSKDLGDT